MGGDFNLIYRAEEKNNSNVDRAMGCFRRFLNDLELKELELRGKKFTWSIERTAPTLVWLDECFSQPIGTSCFWTACCKV